MDKYIMLWWSELVSLWSSSGAETGPTLSLTNEQLFKNGKNKNLLLCGTWVHSKLSLVIHGKWRGDRLMHVDRYDRSQTL